MFHRNYVPILHHFWDIARYWSKIAHLNLPRLKLAPPFGETPSEFRQDLWRLKTRVPALSYDIVCMILHLAIFVQCRLMTNTQTDRQTHDNIIYRASIASRSKNYFKNTAKTFENSSGDWERFKRSSTYGRCSTAEQSRSSAVITWPVVGQSASSDINSCLAYSTATARFICIVTHTHITEMNVKTKHDAVGDGKLRPRCRHLANWTKHGDVSILAYSMHHKKT